MAKTKKSEYKKANAQFLKELRGTEGINQLAGGVLYKVVESGDGDKHPSARSVVTCFYRGALIDGTVFDDAFTGDCPSAFRVNELIDGFQTALLSMTVGDHWTVYIPADAGYGNRPTDGIPGNSTLIFDIRLTGIA